MAKMDDYKARSRQLEARQSPPRAYSCRSAGHRRHCTSQYRRERLVSDILPETRQEREDRRDFERRLAEKTRREEEERRGGRTRVESVSKERLAGGVRDTGVRTRDKVDLEEGREEAEM